MPLSMLESLSVSGSVPAVSSFESSSLGSWSLDSLTSLSSVLGIGMPGPTELIIILVIALLIFGRRLPEVARNMGRGIVEFKKGVKGIEEDVEDNSSASSSSRGKLSGQRDSGQREVFSGERSETGGASDPSGPSGGRV